MVQDVPSPTMRIGQIMHPPEQDSNDSGPMKMKKQSMNLMSEEIRPDRDDAMLSDGAALSNASKGLSSYQNDLIRRTPSHSSSDDESGAISDGPVG